MTPSYMREIAVFKSETSLGSIWHLAINRRLYFNCTREIGRAILIKIKVTASRCANTVFTFFVELGRRIVLAVLVLSSEYWAVELSVEWEVNLDILRFRMSADRSPQYIPLSEAGNGWVGWNRWPKPCTIRHENRHQRTATSRSHRTTIATRLQLEVAWQTACLHNPACYIGWLISCWSFNRARKVWQNSPLALQAEVYLSRQINWKKKWGNNWAK